MADNKFLISGWAFLLYGTFLSILSLLSGKALGLIEFVNIGVNFTNTLIISCAFIYNFSMFFCGYYLLKNNFKIHKFAMVIAIISLANPPIGTTLGAIYLISLYKYNNNGTA